MTRPPHLLVVGGLSVDHAARGPRLPRSGESVAGDGFLVGPGGKGGNAAVQAARLGVRVTMIGCVGSDAEGAFLIRDLHAEGVDASQVRRHAHAPTAATVIQVGGDGAKQTIARGGANRELAPSDVADALRRSFDPSCSQIVLVQLEVPVACLEAAVRFADDDGVPLVLDPAPAREVPPELWSRAHVVTPNPREARELTGVAVHDVRTASEVAGRLRERGVSVAAVAAGGDGTVVAWDGGREVLPLHSVEVVDTTGAGDAFAAAFAVRRAEGASVPGAARFANAAAALATTRLGARAGMASRAAIRDLAGPS